MHFSTLGLVALALGLSAQAVTVSRDARCGSDGNGATCLGSKWGSCCSQYGYCGSTKDYCGTGCQSGFGNCNGVVSSSRRSSSSAVPSPTSSRTPAASPSQPVSKNARCGAAFGGQTCRGSKYGDCCSPYFYCGSTDDYCRPSSCQAEYGRCNSASSSIRSSTRSSSTFATSLSVSSSLASSSVSSSLASSSASSSLISSSASSSVASSSASSSVLSSLVSSSASSSLISSSTFVSSSVFSSASPSPSPAPDNCPTNPYPGYILKCNTLPIGTGIGGTSKQPVDECVASCTSNSQCLGALIFGDGTCQFVGVVTGYSSNTFFNYYEKVTGSSSSSSSQAATSSSAAVSSSALVSPSSLPVSSASSAMVTSQSSTPSSSSAASSSGVVSSTSSSAATSIVSSSSSVPGSPSAAPSSSALASSPAASSSAAASTSPTPVPASPNVVQNGGFENTNNSPWTIQGSRSLLMRSNTAHTGTFSGNIVIAASTNYAVLVSQTVTVTPNTVYALEFWALSGISMDVIQPQFQVSSGTQTGIASPMKMSFFGQYTATFTTGMDTSAILKFSVYGPLYVNQLLLLDDIKLTAQ